MEATVGRGPNGQAKIIAKTFTNTVVDGRREYAEGTEALTESFLQINARVWLASRLAVGGWWLVVA